MEAHYDWKHETILPAITAHSKRSNERTMIILALLAGAGLLLSCLAHLATFLGINPQAVCPGVMLLHIGIFAVWIPTVLVLRKSSGKDFWKESMRFAPSWMRTMCAVFFAYVFFNFFFTIFVLNKGGVPSEIDGKKVLHNHGNVIKELTEEEYQRHEAYSVRTFSGHWMVFYGVAMMVLYSHWKGRHSNKPDARDGL